MDFRYSETQPPSDSESDEMEYTCPPDLAPECNSFKWKVQVIDENGEIEEQTLTTKDVWKLRNHKVIVHFDEEFGQPDEDSGGLLGSWLGQLSNDLNLLPMDYANWKKYPPHRKDRAWDFILRRFKFDNPEIRKKYVLSVLGTRCKDLKGRIWNAFKRRNIKETMLNRPSIVPDDQWRNLATIRFSEKWQRMRVRNTQNQKKNTMPHACGRKSYARKRRDMKKKTGKTPSRAELFIASRKKSNGSFVSDEAKSRVDELTLLMSQNPSDERSNNITASLDDEFSKVFGPERSGRVRCVGRGPTPSKLPKHSTAAIDTSSSEVVELRSTVSSLENTVQGLVGIVQELVGASSVQTTGLVPNISTVLSNLASQPNFAAILSNFNNQSNSRSTESDGIGNQNTGS